MTEKKTGIVENNSESGTCWFCKEHPAEQKAAFSVQMHRDVTHSYILGGRRVDWRRITVSVPRCKRCKSVHTRFKLLIVFGTLLGAIGAGALLVWFISAGIQSWGALVAIFGCFAVGVGIGYAIHWRISPKGIKLMSAGKGSPEVKRLKSEGWKLGAKPGFFE